MTEVDFSLALLKTVAITIYTFVFIKYVLI